MEQWLQVKSLSSSLQYVFHLADSPACLTPTLQLYTLQTYPQIIGYDQEVFKYFEAQYGPDQLSYLSKHSTQIIPQRRSHLCKYDVNLTYPQTGLLPSVPLVNPTQRELPFFASQLTSQTFMTELYRRGVEKGTELQRRGETGLMKRDSSEFLKNRPFDQLDPWASLIFNYL